MKPRAATHFIHLWETPTQYPFSGAENHLWMLLPALAEAGLRVELGALIVRGGPVVDQHLRALEARGIAVTRFPLRPVLDARCLLAVRAFLASRTEHVIHTHLDYADVNVKLAAAWAGCPRRVSSVHNPEPGHLRPHWFWLLRFLDLLTARHIAISTAVRDHLVQRERVAARKVTVIPYGVPLPANDAPGRAAARAQLGLPADRPVVGFVGRLAAQKNVGLLIEALAGMPEALGVVIGDGPERPRLEAQAAGLPNLRFLGHRAQAQDLMPAFDVLCLPSRWEGLGLVLVEAMLRRVPIVATRAGAIPEVLGEGQYGALCASDDAAGLAAALRAALTGDPERVARAEAHARRAYTVTRMVAETLAVYEALT